MGTERFFNILLRRIKQKIAYWLPRWLVYFAAIRVWAHGTQGQWGDTDVESLTISDAISRWDGSSEGSIE